MSQRNNTNMRNEIDRLGGKILKFLLLLEGFQPDYFAFLVEKFDFLEERENAMIVTFLDRYFQKQGEKLPEKISKEEFNQYYDEAISVLLTVAIAEDAIKIVKPLAVIKLED